MNTTKAKDRILSLILTLCLLLGMTLYLPGPVEVYALPSANSEGQPWDGIDFGALKDSGIYYGTYTHVTSIDWNNPSNNTYENITIPVLWRVMGAESGSDNLTLWSEYVLDGQIYDVSSNIWSTSSLAQWLNSAPFLDNFEDAEQGLIAYVTVSSDRNDTATGQQFYLPWGDGSSSLIGWGTGNAENNDAISGSLRGRLRNNFQVYCWLRKIPSGVNVSPDSALYVNVIGNINSDIVDYAYGIRPAFQLNPSSVIFASEISGSADTTKGETQSNSDYFHIAVLGGSAKNYKLTIVSPAVELNGLSVADGRLGGNGTSLTIASGGTLSMTGDFTGAENLVYKIVDRGSNTIVGYGSGTGNDLQVRATANMTGGGGLSPTGNYTLYVWAQKDGGIHSHEGSQPMWYKLKVGTADSNATLATVAGEPITPGANAGNMGDPYTFSINLDAGKDKMTVGDIVPNATNATVNLYTDAGFSADEDSDILLDHGIPTDLYIKVTAEDGTTMRYYKITATRDSANDPSVTIDNNTLQVGDTANLHISLGQSGGAPMATGANIAVDEDVVAVESDTLAADGDVTVTATRAGETDIRVTFDGASGYDTTVRVTVSSSGTTASSGRRSSSSGGSSTPDAPATKTQLPASAFSWDGGRALTIDHDSITPLGLLSVQWDGVETVAYSKYSGSVIVRFDEDFIAAQSAGEHTVKVEFLNHTGETTVTVGGTGLTTDVWDDNDTHNPDTGGYPDSGMDVTDNPDAGNRRSIWTALLLGSAGAAVLAVRKIRPVA